MYLAKYLHFHASTISRYLFLKKEQNPFLILLKSSQNKKGLNDVTAAPFSSVVLQLVAEKKTL